MSNTSNMTEPKIVAILCNWCSYAGADLAGVNRFQYPPTIRIIRVMCSTRVEPSFVLKAFLRGADGVLVGGCHLGDCHYVTGNYYTIGKVNMAKRLLRHAGIDERRLRLEWVSASEGERFANIVTEFTEELKELGPLPEEQKNSLALKAAYNISFSPRIRIIATKERMLTTEGNRYGEIFTSHEMERLANAIVYDELNEEMIRLLIKEKMLTLEEIAKETGLREEIVFRYLMDFLYRQEATFKEENGKIYYRYEGKKEKKVEPFIVGYGDGNGGEGIAFIGSGVANLKKAMEYAEKGEEVFVIERFPSINMNVIRKHVSSLNDEIDFQKFRKMVEEEKIKLITNAYVKEISNRTLKIIRYPTRISNACNNCNICYEVCPIKIVDRERSLFSRKAVYGRDGVPSTYFLEKETPFCQTGCPAHVDVRSYVAKIAEGKFKESVEIIRERLPLPAVLGRVCPHPCEQMCKRSKIEKPISIRLLKRFVADWEWEKEGKIDLGKMPSNENNKYKVAVIGSGPAGLTVAYELARKGYKVTIFDALPVAGGMLAVGIPPYRLPNDVLEREINAILEMGVELKLNTTVGKDISFEELRKNYDAVFIGVGAHKSKKLNIEGEELNGVIPGVDFLREVNISPETVRAVFTGRKVVVIGGGDVAIDAARCAIRLGSEEVTILYRRSRKEMPAREEEIKFAEEEGVTIRYLVSPVKIVGDERVKGVECIEMELGEPDESGRRKPIPKKGSEFFIEADTVISAIGQYPDLSFLPDEIKKTKWGTIVVDTNTAATSMSGVFAGGDAVVGPSIVIEAVAWGRRAAYGIDAYIHGKEVSFDPVEEDVNRLIAYREDIENLKRNVVLSGVEEEERKEVELIPIDERLSTFKEVEKGFSEKDAVEEAKRCLSCRECIGCGICGNECPQNAIDYNEKEKEIEIKAKEIHVDPEIYFESGGNEHNEHNKHNEHNAHINLFELEDMLSLGIVTTPDGKKPEKVVFISDGKNKYIERLMEGLKKKGVKSEVTKVSGNGALIVNCKFKESEYYKKLKRRK